MAVVNWPAVMVLLESRVILPAAEVTVPTEMAPAEARRVTLFVESTKPVIEIGPAKLTEVTKEPT